MRGTTGVGAAVILGAYFSAGCMQRCAAEVAPRLQSGVQIGIVNNAIEDVDVLFEIDNSQSMSENQAYLARNFGVLIDRLVNPPTVRDPATGMDRRRYEPVKSLRVGVISSDLGTPGSVVPSCANTDAGDDGRLNPIRNGRAMSAHEPWASAPPNRRPARCTNDPAQYPSFLTFDAASTDAAQFRDDFICNAYLSATGCGLEQQLESAYRALVIHDARERAGNASPNAGFVRDNAVLAIVLVTDEEDGSTRDCRYAEQGVPCTDGVDVFDQASGQWSSPNDLNLRFYTYAPGSAQDPTWNIDRYIDPQRPNRGFTSLKPGRPDLVVFSAIAGVPINLPMRAGSTDVDWDALLGRNPDGSDGYTGPSAEGDVSMKQANLDRAPCTGRVVPACRREGSPLSASCEASGQYFAWPSRRIAQVARRFAERYSNGTISSICKNDYGDALAQIVERIQARFVGRCLARPLETAPAACPAGTTAGPAGCVRVNCGVREVLPAGMTAARACTAERGRTPGPPDRTGRETCVVNQVTAPVDGAPAAGSRGFFYDTRPDPQSPTCRRNIRFTPGAETPVGATDFIECVQAQDQLPMRADAPSGACQ